MNDLIMAGLYVEGMAVHLQEDSSKYKLMRAGYTVLGSGCYGYAVDIPGNEYIVKVCVDPRDGYLMYAKWAMANPGPGIPNFKAMVEVGKVTCVIMPRLVELTPDQDELVQLAKGGFGHGKDYYYLLKAIRKIRTSLGSFANEDMHLGNFMYDKKRKQIVCTDPYTNVYGEHHATDIKMFSGMREQLPLVFEEPETWNPSPWNSSHNDLDLIRPMGFGDYAMLEAKVIAAHRRDACVLQDFADWG